MVKDAKKGRAKRTAKATVAAKKTATKKQAAKKPVKKEVKPAVTTSLKLPGSFRLSGQALMILSTFWKPISGIFLIYLSLNLLLASGLSVISSNISALREEVAGQGRLDQALMDFGSLAGGAGWSGGETSSALQSILFIIASLAIIWALRQLLSGEKITVKQAYYQGMAPLIPYVLLTLVIIVQILPMTIGAALLGIVSTGAFGPVVTVIFTIAFLLLTTWTLYMLSCSVVALYIVTLPHMQPRQALRSAKNLVKNRRWAVMRRLIFLPFLILAAMAAIFIPILLIVPPLAAPLFFAAATLAVFIVHTYLYNLYRRLLA